MGVSIEDFKLVKREGLPMMIIGPYTRSDLIADLEARTAFAHMGQVSSEARTKAYDEALAVLAPMLRSCQALAVKAALEAGQADLEAICARAKGSGVANTAKSEPVSSEHVRLDASAFGGASSERAVSRARAALDSVCAPVSGSGNDPVDTETKLVTPEHLSI